jgi:hypothetical protein
MNHQKMIEGIRFLDRIASIAPLNRQDHMNVQNVVLELIQGLNEDAKKNGDVKEPALARA